MSPAAPDQTPSVCPAEGEDVNLAYSINTHYFCLSITDLRRSFEPGTSPQHSPRWSQPARRNNNMSVKAEMSDLLMKRQFNVNVHLSDSCKRMFHYPLYGCVDTDCSALSTNVKSRNFHFPPSRLLTTSRRANTTASLASLGVRANVRVRHHNVSQTHQELQHGGITKRWRQQTNLLTQKPGSKLKG